MSPVSRLVAVCLLLHCVSSFALVPSAPKKHQLTADPLFKLFQEFMRVHQKEYHSEEELQYRFQTFAHNMKQHPEAHAQALAGTHTPSKFADLSPAEFKSQMLLNKPPTPFVAPKVASLSSQAPPPWFFLDWRQQGRVVTPVRDQGQCGDPVAWVVVEELESIWNIVHRQAFNLSTQQIVSCDTVDAGCNGGMPETTVQYIMQAGGLQQEYTYPYTAGSGTVDNCTADPTLNVATISGFQYVSFCNDTTCNSDKVNESAMENALVNIGPLMVCVNAVPWQMYQGGVFTDSTCTHAASDIDHCSQLVGYNRNAPIPYWIVRNSWGANWGDKGYIYIKQGVNLCGIANQALYLEV